MSTTEETKDVDMVDATTSTSAIEVRYLHVELIIYIYLCMYMIHMLGLLVSRTCWNGLIIFSFCGCWR